MLKSIHMKDSISLSIPKPCNEKWNNFTPTAGGGFCANCRKEVVDFTGFTEAQLLAYLDRPGSSSLCGRFREDQLKTYPLPPVKTTRKNLTVWAALSATLALASPQAKAGATTDIVLTEALATDHTVTTNSQKNDTAVTKTVTGIVRSSLDNLPISRARVILKNTLQEVTTDTTGRFTIVIDNPKPDDTLVFNMIGFYVAEQSVPASGAMDVMLRDWTHDLLQGSVGGLVVRRYSPRNIWWKIRHVFR
jgi:hypothetical protein